MCGLFACEEYNDVWFTARIRIYTKGHPAPGRTSPIESYAQYLQTVVCFEKLIILWSSYAKCNKIHDATSRRPFSMMNWWWTTRRYVMMLVLVCLVVVVKEETRWIVPLCCAAASCLLPCLYENMTCVYVCACVRVCVCCTVSKVVSDDLRQRRQQV